MIMPLQIFLLYYVAIFLVICWPFLLVSIFVFLNQDSLVRKRLFFIIGVGICYLVKMVDVLLIEPALMPSEVAPIDMGWRVAEGGAFWPVELLLSVLALVLLLRRFSRSR